MHLPPLIQDLAVILGVAGLMSLIFQKIRQPVVLGYIIAGMIVGPYTPPFQLVTDIPSIHTWAELGVIFLMFTLGLEFSFRKLARVGASAGITASIEVLFFLPVGYGIGKLFGWSTMDSIFLGAMLAISSTTIIIKALDELKLKSSRFAELIFGVLIVEDLIAILLLVGLTTVATSETVSGVALLSAAGKLTLVVGGWFLVGYFAVPRLMRYVGRVGNNEMLTLLSIGLCLGLVVFASYFHYSAALGAFIMGSILAESSLLPQIESRMEPLRDLFGAIFFVSIGMLIDPRSMWEHKGVIAVLCFVTIVGKILSTGFGALVSGQTFRNSVRVGFGLAQIGEFSFIIAGVGMTLKVTSDFVYPVAVAVSLVTTFTTPYLIKISGPLAERLEDCLPTRIRNLLNQYALWSEDRRTATGNKKGLHILVLQWLTNEDGEKDKHQADVPKLAPWDAHLVRIQIHSNASFAGKTLTESALRNRHGINVVAIQRGVESIVAPKPDTQLFPQDELLVLGTDENIETVRPFLEGPIASSMKTQEFTNYELKHFEVSEASHSILNTSIRQSGIRERFGAMVVGIERNQKRIMNPDSDTTIHSGDMLWIVGSTESLSQLQQELIPDDQKVKL